MNTHEAFMQTIIANPDDDAPRLVYADWLEENGYEMLAEFIRIQIELFQRHPEGGRARWIGTDSEIEKWLASLDPGIRQLRIREEELLKNRVMWRRVPPGFVQQGDYCRGLLKSWCGDVTSFLKYSDDLWSYGPIRGLHLRGRDREFERLAECPALARIESLSINPNSILDRGGIALAQSDYASKISKLTVHRYGKRITPEALNALTTRFGSSLSVD